MSEEEAMATNARRPVEDIIEAARKVLVEASRRADDQVVISVPIWGWWGDGKTTALLTLVGCCDETRHGVAVRLLSDTDDLAEAETAHDEYRDLNLVGVAAATRSDLQEKLTQFLDERQWPVGTDAPSPYVFGLSGVVGDLGFLYMPDLPGGHYMASEEEAKAVLARAHGTMILVEPRRYQEKSAQGKQYKDEVHTRLRKCHKAGLPTAILITKGDRASAKEAADETFASLSLTLQHFDKHRFHLATVSVLGLDGDPPGGDVPELPAADERNPEHLLAAFLWLLGEVFEGSGDQLRGTVPAVRMQRIRTGTHRAPRDVVPELKPLGQFSGMDALVLCPLPTKANKHRMLLSTDAGLIELSFGEEGNLNHARHDAGTWMPAPELDADLTVADYRDGTIFAGSRRATACIWRGHLGDNLVEEHLPFDLVSWTPVSAEQVVGLDSSARLHRLRLENGSWKQDGFVPKFVSNPHIAALWVSPSGEQVIAVSSGEVASARLGRDALERTATTDGVAFDTDTAVVNRVGVAAMMSADGKVILTDDEHSVTVGSAIETTRTAMALANRNATVAYVGTDNIIKAASMVGGNVRTAKPIGEVALPDVPTSMAWSHDDKYLIVMFDNGAWGVWQAVGVHG